MSPWTASLRSDSDRKRPIDRQLLIALIPATIILVVVPFVNDIQDFSVRALMALLLIFVLSVTVHTITHAKALIFFIAIPLLVFTAVHVRDIHSLREMIVMTIIYVVVVTATFWIGRYLAKRPRYKRSRK